MFVFEKRIHSEDFDKVLKKGKITHSPLFSLSYLKLEDQSQAFAVVASKKVSKKAVIRNRNKRRVRHILKKIASNLPSGAYAVFIKKDLAPFSHQELLTEVNRLLN